MDTVTGILRHLSAEFVCIAGVKPALAYSGFRRPTISFFLYFCWHVGVATLVSHPKQLEMR
jgi:hypothetical protein